MSTSALATYTGDSFAEPEPSMKRARIALSAYFDQGVASQDATPTTGPSHTPFPVSPLNLDPLEKPRDCPRLRETSTEIVVPLRKQHLPTSASSSSIDPTLSHEHYLLRLAVSFLIRSLPLALRASGFAKNVKTSEMKAVAEERLAALGRMEKAWGPVWTQAVKLIQAGGVESCEGERNPLSSLEDKVRRVGVGRRTKEREGRQFVEALADGILLCL